MILSGGEVAKFNDVNRPWLIPDDVPFALDIDRYDFAIKVAIEEAIRLLENLRLSTPECRSTQPTSLLGQTMPFRRKAPCLNVCC